MNDIFNVLAKVTKSAYFLRHVCPSGRPSAHMYQRGSRWKFFFWMDFDNGVCCSDFVERFHVWLKSDKTFGHLREDLSMFVNRSVFSVPFSLPLFTSVFLLTPYHLYIYIGIGYRNNFTIHPCTSCIYCLSNKSLKKKHVCTPESIKKSS